MAGRKKSRRILTVVRLARHEVEAAARALAEAQQFLEAQRQRLGELEVYRSDYARRLQQQGSGGMSIARLTDYRAFLSRLDEAIHQQRQRVAQGEAELERRTDAWRQARLRHRSVDSYHQRCLEEEQREAWKKEQKESDERAQHRRSL